MPSARSLGFNDIDDLLNGILNDRVLDIAGHAERVRQIGRPDEDQHLARPPSRSQAAA